MADTLALINELERVKSTGTTLVSYYVKGGAELGQINSTINNELRTCQNIKSKATKKAVNASLKSIQSHLKEYKQVPEFGFAIFSGHQQCV